MEIRVTKSISINTVEQWFTAAPPKDPKIQWKNGRSAKELARFVTDPSFRSFIRMVLKELKIQEQDFECEPEAETSFVRQEQEDIDMGINGPRNHDLLMIGKTCVIGVEAKVSEKFGENLVRGEWEKASTLNKKEKRIPGLIQFLSNGKYKDYVDTPDSIKDLHYQLLTATVATVLEAKRRKKKDAIVLVLIFTGNVAKEDNYENNVKYNNDAFNNFLKEFFDNTNTPRKIQGVNCRIIKKEIEIKSNHSFKERRLI